jgi:hypothetical protein
MSEDARRSNKLTQDPLGCCGDWFARDLLGKFVLKCPVTLEEIANRSTDGAVSTACTDHHHDDRGVYTIRALVGYVGNAAIGFFDNLAYMLEWSRIHHDKPLYNQSLAQKSVHEHRDGSSQDELEKEIQKLVGIAKGWINRVPEESHAIAGNASWMDTVNEGWRKGANEQGGFCNLHKKWVQSPSGRNWLDARKKAGTEVRRSLGGIH